MTSSHVSIGSGDHHVLAVHGWFGSSRSWGSLPDYLDRSTYTYTFKAPVSLATSIEEFLGRA